MATPFRRRLPLSVSSVRAVGEQFITVHGYGHCAFLTPGTCTGDYMTACIRTGALPSKGRGG